jgi:uncharacterized protein (TIGR00251 family)
MISKLQLSKGQVINVTVVCNSRVQEIQEVLGNYKVKLKSCAIKGKANKELIEYFKSLGYLVDIVKGEKSKQKLIKVL